MKNILLISVLLSIFSNINCAFASNDELEDKYSYNYSAHNSFCDNIYDPYEKLNRKIFYFNGALDNIILKPVTKIYGRVTNDYTRGRFSSFLKNI